MPVINKPIQYFSVATWNGSGSATATIDFGMQPDLVVIKPRNNVAANANAWVVVDSTRGTSARLSFNNTAPEWTESNNVISFNSTGITVGDSHNVNKNTTSQYVGYGWKKGATQGFDIVTASLSGTSPVTVNHSLGVAPKLIIGKVRDVASTNWYVYSASIAASDYLLLNSTAAKATSSNIWDVAPTSAVFTVGNPQNGWAGGNAGSKAYVFYLFSEVAGFSQFGSYTGNGSTDGPFVFLGFRPAFVMIKKTSATDDWVIFDTARDTFNVVNDWLFPNLSNAELTTAGSPDVLSNGFKLRSTSGATNASGATFIYAAFAEHPFKNALAR
jgi:hypothetical protein